MKMRPYFIVCLLFVAKLTVVTCIQRVHVIFSNHLDIGFTSTIPFVPGTDAKVLTRYFRDYFPAAILTADAMRGKNSTERYRYLTHSFLVSLYLDCPPFLGIYCPSQRERASFEAAIRRGDIVWHALPHNLQAEFMDKDLLQWAVHMAHSLDARFGLEPKHTASQRDVPGLTRAAIPILAEAGVTALSVGVNSGSAPPGVPKYTPFVWRDEATNASLLAFWHPGGYSALPVDSRSDCITVDGFDHALCGSWRNDNEGPHFPSEVSDVYARLRTVFPEAEDIVASTLDDFTELLIEAAPSLDLPVVVEEIGDTWIYGVASDPGKVSEYRALLRVRRESHDQWDDPAFGRFSRMLMKIPEHTWGVDSKQYPGDYERWSNQLFHRALSEKEPNFETAIYSWKRQRNYTLWAVEELYRNPVAIKARAALDELHRPVQQPTPANGFMVKDLNKGRNFHLSFTSHAWELRLDEASGALSGLQFVGGSGGNKIGCWKAGGLWRVGCLLSPSGWKGSSGLNWAGPESLLAQIVYSTYGEEDYSTFWEDYAFRSVIPDWFYKDFGKPNSTLLGGARRRDAVPSVRKIWHRGTLKGGLHVVVEGGFSQDLVRDYGAPATIYIEYQSPEDSDDLLIDIIMENKTATRLPEAFWVKWRPAVASLSTWSLSKLGRMISPLEVMLNGSQSMHAVDDGGVSVHALDGSARLNIRSLDVALVSPGEATPFPSLKTKPNMTHGISFCVVNNIWGTNYVMWWPYQESDAVMRFRFIVNVEQLDARSGWGNE